jgi:hypothetical protein
MSSKKSVLIDLLDKFMEETFEGDEMQAIVLSKWQEFKDILGEDRLDHGKAFTFIR